MSAREYLINCYRVQPPKRKRKLKRPIKLASGIVAPSRTSFKPLLRKLSLEAAIGNDTDYIITEHFLKQRYANVWDHISRILVRIMVEGPKSVIQNFETLSRFVKMETMHQREEEDTEPEPIVMYRVDRMKDGIESNQIPATIWEIDLERETKKLKLIKSIPFKDEDDAIPLEEEPSTYFNLIEQMSYFEEVGISLPKHELYEISIGMQKLVQTNPIANIRFWGKVFGQIKNYIVVECKMTEDEIGRRRESDGEKPVEITDEEAEEIINRRFVKYESWAPTKIIRELMTEEALKNAILKDKSKLVEYCMPPLPRLLPVCRVRIPPELSGDGCNKKVYFVCNDPTKQWTMLPNVKPEHIVAARRIQFQVTGNLDTPLETWTGLFPGTEKEYLRAQIARISASTQVSPMGYYKFEGEGEEEEEEEVEEEEAGGKSKPIEQNKHYIPLPLRDMTDKTMAFWVHHCDHILKQGRVEWWKEPKSAGEGAEEEGEEGEVDEEIEKGPKLLSRLLDDASREVSRIWSVRASTTHLPDNSVVLVRSNLWIGAYAFAAGSKSDTLYMGTGMKFRSSGFSPPILDWAVQEMYDVGPDVLEYFEPTLEMENEWRKKREKPEVLAPDAGHGGEGEGEGGDKEEGEDEEEDED